MPEPVLTVVVADDDDEVRAALRDLLQAAADIEVLAAVRSAPEVVAACADAEPDVALVDIAMPGDALAAIRRITAQPNAAKVVVLTADDDPALEAASRSSGAQRFVLKSNGDDLVEVVRETAAD